MNIEGLTWPECHKRFSSAWQPGEHVCLIAPTGQGKTTILTHLLNSRRYVLALDPKGGDTTLRSTGYPRLNRWPPPRSAYRKMEERKPVRYLVGPVTNTPEDMARLREVCRQALRGAFTDRGWTVAIDEFQVAADRRMMGLGTDTEKLLIAARDKKCSVVTLFQAPRNVPRAAMDQARWVWVSLTYDTDVVGRLAEVLGHDRAEVRGAIRGLGAKPYAWLLASRNPRDPFVVTIPHPARRMRAVSEPVA